MCSWCNRHLEYKTDNLLPLTECSDLSFSKCGSQTSRTGITWEKWKFLVTPQICGIRKSGVAPSNLC